MSLDELLSAHGASISALRADVLPPATAGGAPIDDVFLLRFVLSFPEGGTARADALKRCVEWRTSHEALLADAAAGRPAPSSDVLEPFMVAAPHGVGKDGSQLFIVRAGLSNPSATMALVTTEQLLAHMMYFKEVAFLHCDRETRARNRMVKQVVIIDMQHTSLFNTDSRYFKVIAESGKLSETVYPQLLGRSVLMHPPSFLAAMMAIFRPLMSKKQLEKQALCPGSSAASPSASACPYASKMFDLADLPTFIGGSCTCTHKGGCVCGWPNSENKVVPSGGRAAPIVVSARSHHDILLTARAAGGTLSYSVSVAEKGIEWSLTLAPVGGGPSVTLVETKKLRAEDGAAKGEIAVPSSGLVTLHLDNTYSWLVSKTVTATISFSVAPTFASTTLHPTSAANS
jgi:hypothetical protein